MGSEFQRASPTAGRVAPFAAVAALSFMTVPLPPAADASGLAWAAALLIVLVAAVIVVPGARPGRPWGLVAPVAYLLVVALMRDAQGGPSSGYAPLALLPVLWLALYGRRWQVAVSVVGVATVFVLPLLGAGSAEYATSEWRRAALWTAVSALVGFSVHPLVTRRTREAYAHAAERDFIDAVVDTQAALVVVLDRHARVVRFNPAAERASGIPAAAAVGQVFWELALVPVEDGDGVRSAFERLLAADFPNEHENWWVARNGARRRIAWTSTAIVDTHGDVTHVVATGIDVTSQREAEDAVRAEAERFGSVLRAAAEYSIIGTTLDGTITVLGEGAERMLGYTADEMIGLRTPAAIHDPAEVSERAVDLGVEPGFEVFVAAARRGESETREWTYIRADGDRVPVSLTVTAVRGGDGRPVGFIGSPGTSALSARRSWRCGRPRSGTGWSSTTSRMPSWRCTTPTCAGS